MTAVAEVVERHQFDRAKEEILREYGFNMDDGYVEIYARRRIGQAETSENE